jgi:hypothetical protein
LTTTVPAAISGQTGPGTDLLSGRAGWRPASAAPPARVCRNTPAAVQPPFSQVPYARRSHKVIGRVEP